MNPFLYRIAAQFAQGICGYPMRRFGIHFLWVFCQSDDCLIESRVAFADVTQHPVDSLFDKITLIGSNLFDELEISNETLRGLILSINSSAYE